MLQSAMGADNTGPIEFWPVEGSGPNARIDFRYANGTEVHSRFPGGQGPQLGGVFVGTECKMEINRNKFTTNPPDFVKHPPDPRLAEKWEGDGWVAIGHIENWLDCIRSREKPNADVEIGHRSITIAHLMNIAREVRPDDRTDHRRCSGKRAIRSATSQGLGAACRIATLSRTIGCKYDVADKNEALIGVAAIVETFNCR
jgi:hypothetical protein